MKTRESDTRVIVSGTMMLVVATVFYFQGAAEILLAIIFGYVLAEMYCRTSFGRRTNKKLRAFFWSRPDST